MQKVQDIKMLEKAGYDTRGIERMSAAGVKSGKRGKVLSSCS